MRKNQKKSFYQVLALLVPFLTLINPPYLSLLGVGPRWAELWLLPWALYQGPIAGMFAGFCLGMMGDAINLGINTQLPALMLLGYFWGCLGQKKEYIDKPFSLGLFALFGSFLSGLLVWFQEIVFGNINDFVLFNKWAFQTILAGSVMTGFLAPFLCQLCIRTFFQRNSRN